MKRLIGELQRLYFLPGQLGCAGPTGEAGQAAANTIVTSEMLVRSLAGESPASLELLDGSGMARLLLLDFRRAADWPAVDRLYQVLRDELDLPPPAVSVSGLAGYRLWFSLLEPVPQVQALAFLEALRQRYLSDLPPVCVESRPSGRELGPVDLVPARHEESGKWSAFIDPSMGSMFIDEPGLEMVPNLERQADMLAPLLSIKSEDFTRALAFLQAPPAVALASSLPVEAVAVAPPRGEPTCLLNVGGSFSDPRSFLLAVMNDQSAGADQRIEAAKALLPYYSAQVLAG